MKNRIYYIVLIVLIVLAFPLKRYVFTGPVFMFIAGGIIVLYIWCKDVFTGAGWFKKSKPVIVSPSAHTSAQFTETIVAAPIKAHEKQGYLNLMHELVAPSFHVQLEPFINNLKTFDDRNDEFEPLYSLSDFADEREIAFISLLDWKSAIEDLIWRIASSLKQNYDLIIELPSETQWEPRASVSYDNVFKTFDNALRLHGFQLGFINTGGDDYALMVFKKVQKLKIEEAVKRTGYGYYEIV